MKRKKKAHLREWRVLLDADDFAPARGHHLPEARDEVAAAASDVQDAGVVLVSDGRGEEVEHLEVHVWGTVFFWGGFGFFSAEGKVNRKPVVVGAPRCMLVFFCTSLRMYISQVAHRSLSPDGLAVADGRRGVLRRVHGVLFSSVFCCCLRSRSRHGEERATTTPHQSNKAIRKPKSATPGTSL